MDDIAYIAGLDLGQATDYTALAILERTRPAVRAVRSFQEDLYRCGMGPIPVGAPPKQLCTHAVRHLERFPLGTPYPTICGRLVDLFAQPPLSGETLVVDQTGVGRAVVDMIHHARPQAKLRPITITGGHSVVGQSVPKKELVSVLQVLFQSRRLHVARRLSNAPVLIRELETFRVKVTASANETFEAWRERDHDDLVLAVALAAWVGELGQKQLCFFV